MKTVTRFIRLSASRISLSLSLSLAFATFAFLSLTVTIPVHASDCYWYYPPEGPSEYICSNPDPPLVAVYYTILTSEPDWNAYSNYDYVYVRLTSGTNWPRIEWFVVPAANAPGNPPMNWTVYSLPYEVGYVYNGAFVLIQ